MKTMTRLLSAICFACLSAAALAAPPAPAIVTIPIAKTNTTIIGQKFKVPKNPTVIATSMVFMPGARTPIHKHLYPHYAYIEEGTLTVVNTETGKTYVTKPGTFFSEMLNTWHYGINKGTVPVRILVIDQVPAGVQTNSVMKDPKEAKQPPY
jgi:quercetin dioxygenase-like cupin family protein